MSTQGNEQIHAPGMTLRDYFAAKAVAALIAEPRWGEGESSVVYTIGPRSTELARNFAEAAYAIADAMLEARK